MGEPLTLDNFDQYQRLAASTMNQDMGTPQRLGNCALGLADEYFELTEAIFDETCALKKPSADTPDYSRFVLLELGDLLWYCAVLLDTMSIKLSDACAHLDFDKSTVYSPGDFKVVMRDAHVGMGRHLVPITTHIKHVVYHGHEMSEEYTTAIEVSVRNTVIYVQTLAACFVHTLQDVMELNVEKLAKRYPEGHFSTERSVNRDD